MKKDIFKPVVILLCLACIVFGITLFYGCEKSEIISIEEQFIDIKDLNNPATFAKSYNVNKYLEAYSRVMEHVSIKQNLMTWEIKSGHEVNISEELFSYISNYLENVNKNIKIGKLKVYKINGKIEIYRNKVSGLVRLKKSGEGGNFTPVNFTHSSQSIGEEFISAFNAFPNSDYNTEDLFNLGSGNFSIINDNKHGSFTLGGYTFQWYFVDITMGGSSPVNNDMCTNNITSEYQFQLLYCMGLSGATITAPTQQAAAYLKSRLTRWP
jgi:hypothetical protein